MDELSIKQDVGQYVMNAKGMVLSANFYKDVKNGNP